MQSILQSVFDQLETGWSQWFGSRFEWLSAARCSIGGILAATVLALASLSASAGDITFNLSLTGSTLRLTQQGSSSAFYPVVLRMLADGQWQPLAIAPGETAPAEMVAGDHLDFVWPEKRALQSLPPFERIQPMMVRFFDQAGVNLGQISFFNQPPVAGETLAAGYVNGQLEITPPADNPGAIRSSWLLWAQEEGITSILKPIRFDHQQPQARHIEWRSGMGKLRVATGAKLPESMLLHETAQGYTLQSLPGGFLQGEQQRAAWLDAGKWFYGASGLALVLAFGFLLHYVFRARRRGVAA